MERPKLIIEVLENGQVNVNGPIQNKLLCYGLLEVARDAIRDYVEKNQSPIVQAPAAVLNQLNGVQRES